jgi:hypothetical protein
MEELGYDGLHCAASKGDGEPRIRLAGFMASEERK